MAEKSNILPRKEDFREHYAEFGNTIQQPVNKSIASIMFMVTRPIPVIKNIKDEQAGTVQVEVGMDTELQHSCTVTMPIDQLLALKNNIEEFLSKHK